MNIIRILLALFLLTSQFAQAGSSSVLVGKWTSTEKVKQWVTDEKGVYQTTVWEFTPTQFKGIVFRTDAGPSRAMDMGTLNIDYQEDGYNKWRIFTKANGLDCRQVGYERCAYFTVTLQDANTIAITRIQLNEVKDTKIYTRVIGDLTDKVKPTNTPLSQTSTNNNTPIQSGDVIVGKLASVKVYKEANKKSGLLTHLSKNDEAIYLGEEQNGLYKITSGENEGWVDKLLVKKP